MSQAITGLGTRYYIGSAVGDPFSGWTLLGELASFDLDRAWDTADVTNFNSGTDKEAKKTLRNPGTFTLYGNRLQSDPGQIILRVAFDDPRAYHFLVILPFGEQWSFHGLVLSVDPPLFAPGRTLRFVSKVQVTGPKLPYPGFGNATGMATKTSSRTLSSFTYGIFWKSFALTGVLPQDAQIQGIYPTIIATANEDICFHGLEHGNVADPAGSLGLPSFPGGIGFAHPFDPNGFTPAFPPTQFWGSQAGSPDSVGTSLADLANQRIFMFISSSLFVSPIFDWISAEAVGFAIYYESETPLVDPLMPPPFAVPAGQGLAWAVPFEVGLLAENQDNGTTVGTAAVLL
jgi:hypothetical protein